MNYSIKSNKPHPKFFLVLFSLSIFALISCQDFDASEGNKNSDECIVTFSAQNASRQAMPSSFSKETLSYSLSYYKNEEPDNIHKIGDTEHFSYSSLSQAQLLLSPAEWTFTLNAYRNNYPILAATVTKEIVRGVNSITFNLEETDFNYGGINVNLSFLEEKEKVASMAVYASLYEFSAKGIGESSVNEQKLEIFESSYASSEISSELTDLMGYWSVNYRAGVNENAVLDSYGYSTDNPVSSSADILDNTIEKGMYVLVFNFYDNESKENLLGTYSEFVIVGPGAVSSSSCFIEDITDIYNIFYENMEDCYDYYGWLERVPTTFTSYSTVTLPALDRYDYNYYPIEKYRYVFKGWYLTPDFSGEAQTEILAGTEHDVTLYAKWEPDLDFCSFTATAGENNSDIYGMEFSDSTATITLKSFHRDYSKKTDDGYVDITDSITWQASLKIPKDDSNSYGIISDDNYVEVENACTVSGNTVTLTFPSDTKKLSRTPFVLFVTATLGDQTTTTSFSIYKAAEYKSCGISISQSTFTEFPATATLTLTDTYTNTVIDNVTWSFEPETTGLEGTINGNELTLNTTESESSSSYSYYSFYAIAHLGEESFSDKLNIHIIQW